jgi:UDP-glucose 4-epimerase
MIVITGGCGFIGGHLADALGKVRVIDVKKGYLSPEAEFVKCDVRKKGVIDACKGADTIYHFAADPDVKVSVGSPMKTFETNTAATINLLEAARLNSSKFIFASTSTIYGEAKPPTSEDSPALPISPYGASKAACDAFISAYSHTYGIDAVSCVYGNIFGPRSDHGVVFDFYNKLMKNPNEMEILGDGKQKKSYLYISDAISATLLLAGKVRGYNKYNIALEGWTTVNEIAEVVSDELGLSPKFTYTGGERGWVGDVPKFRLDISKLKSLGWKQEVPVEDGIRKYVQWLKSRR